MKVVNYSLCLVVFFLIGFPVGVNAQTVPHELIVKLRQPGLVTEEKGEFRPSPTVFKSVQKSLITVSPLFRPASSSGKSLSKQARAFKKSFFILRTKTSVNSDSLLRVLRALPQVEYAVRNHLFRVDWTPDDPDLSKQWGLRKIQAEQAWNVTRGDPSVLLAVIDTGIDYDHPDLKKAIWINPGEDLNHNGRVDSSDFNGVDDDGNGFVDDIQGWDFVDAPNYPDGGDYRNRDNNPADENGHGTAVAGIIAATADNGIGVAGVAPGCRVMNLRAGTSRGLLEEDDVAAAVMYAVENGARVINMSFGDVAITPFLRDVIQFATESNVLCVASSGNSGNSKMHYPSGLPQTLSVGASTAYDARASFSTYGISLDLVAPGQQILTTLRNNSYGEVSGTSAAAPFVTGSAGLVLSQHPDFSAEMLKQVLISTADDLGEAGWDSTFGAGRLNAFRALEVSDAPVAEMTSPKMDQGFSGGTIEITGTASSPLFRQARISVGTGDNPSDWTPLKSLSTYQVIDDTLAEWSVPQTADTSFTLRLQVLNTDGTEADDFVRVFVDHTAPVVRDSLILQAMLSGNRRVLLGEFATDDVCTAALFYRDHSDTGPFRMKSLPFSGRANSFLVDPVSFPDQGDFYLTLRNRAGLVRRLPEGTGLIHFDLTDAFYPQILEETRPISVPSGYLLPDLTDFNQNGQPELVLNQYKKNGQSFGPLAIYEWNGRDFTEVYQTPYVAIPRDTGDVNGDGHTELLAGAGGTTYLFARGADGWPSRLVWWDSTDVWASRLADLDGDGKKDILARKGSVFTLFHNAGDFQFVPTDSFPNPTAGTNGTGVPHVEIGDFTENGQKDLLFGDYDGDVYLYEVSPGGAPRVIWTDHLPLMDTIDFLASGDFDGNGSTDFAVGCHSKPDIDLEHVFDNRRWLVRIYTHVAGDSFAVAWQQEFYGFHSPKNFPSGMTAGDVTGDGRADLLLGFYPNFYVIHFDAASAAFVPVWCGSPARTNSAVTGDLDGDGRNELVYDSGNGLQRFQLPGGTHIRPKFFEDFKAIPLDTERVALSWKTVAAAVSFRIFRAELNASDSIQIGKTTADTFLDSTAHEGQIYRYWILAEKNRETQTSSPKMARPHRPVRLDSARAVLPNQYRLYFSEGILPKSVQRESFTLVQPELSSVNRKRHPVSFVVGHGGREILLTDSLESVPAGTVQVSVSALSDSEGTPVDVRFRRAKIAVPSQIYTPYMTRADFLPPNHIKLWFNEPMDSLSAVLPDHYRITPFIAVLKASWNPAAPDQVLLSLGRDRPIGALGVRYQLTVQGVKNRQGISVEKGRGDHKTFQFYRTDLSRVFTYPNPVRLGTDTKVIFANLTRTATIWIFNLQGLRVASLEERNGDGGTAWDLKLANGEYVPAGIYIFRVTNGSETKMGKFAVIK
ncbi:MAG: S8 family serine peptidase [Calditrichaeota bacterium]|nr:S8 family serine peptidase [Calditrichota bacterium]